MTDRRPVVFLGHTAAPSGAELAYARLAAQLRARGVPVSVLLLASGPLTAILDDAEVPVTVISGKPGSLTRGAGPLALVRGAAHLIADGRLVAAAIESQGAGVIVAESTKTLLVGAVAARKVGVPLVWQVHDRLSAEYFGLLRWPLRILGRAAAAGFLANSRGTLRTLSTRGRLAAVCYPGVDLGSVPPPAPQRAPDDVRITMVGRITPWKGQDLVLRAIARMDAATTVRFVGGAHFGEEEYAVELVDLAHRLGVGDRVEFVGHVDDPLAEVAAADIVVHYSRLTEPFGQVVAEAMAAGRAVVAARAGGPTELINDGDTGLLVVPRRPDLLAVALDRLVADRALRIRLGGAARERARDIDLRTSAAVADSLLARVERGARAARNPRALRGLT